MMLRVILADLVAEINRKSNESVKFPAPIRATLQIYFDRIIQTQVGNQHFPFRSVLVQWWSLSFRGGSRKSPGSSPLSLAPRDLIVYFVREPSDSVLRYLAGTGSPHPNGSGFTKYTATETASEVYTRGNQNDPVGLANVAFHELMHQVSGFDGARLHVPDGLAAEQVQANTNLSPGNIRFMVNHLQSSNRRPWTDGYRQYTDPMNGHI